MLDCRHQAIETSDEPDAHYGIAQLLAAGRTDPFDKHGGGTSHNTDYPPNRWP